jgi:hypothetical protein
MDEIAPLLKYPGTRLCSGNLPNTGHPANPEKSIMGTFFALQKTV